jgi:hypothetical protein
MDNVIQFQPASTSRFGPVDRVVPVEPFVDENVVADFLVIEPRRVLEMARKALIPAHPLGDKRKTWRFKISEIDAHFSLPAQKRAPGMISLAVPVTPQRRKLG